MLQPGVSPGYQMNYNLSQVTLPNVNPLPRHSPFLLPFNILTCSGPRV
jgi:hypothetical protein